MVLCQTADKPSFSLISITTYCLDNQLSNTKLKTEACIADSVLGNHLTGGFSTVRGQRTVAKKYRKHILNSNLVNSYLPITCFFIAQSFWNFAQSTAMILPCSVQNFKRIGQLEWLLWINKFFLLNLSLHMNFWEISYIVTVISKGLTWEYLVMTVAIAAQCHH